jgi:hypothetical protein
MLACTPERPHTPATDAERSRSTMRSPRGVRIVSQSLFKMPFNRECINHLSSRTPAQRVEGSAVVASPATSRSLLGLRPRSG